MRVLCGLGLLGALLLITAPDVYADVPPQRLHMLSRGINLDNAIYEQPESPAEWNHDLASIRHAGFYHVRIFIDQDDWSQERLTTNPKIAKLDMIVQAAVRNHLAVILCMYSRRYPMDNTADAETVQHWLSAWRIVAQRYGRTPIDNMYYEIANEPGMDGVRWSGVQEQLRAAIRAIAPKHTLLLTASPLAMVWSFPTLEVSRDKNVAYIFHLYQPMVFTHQGAGWAKPAYKEITSLEYPPNADNMRALLGRPLVAANADSVKDLQQYGQIGAVIMGNEIAKAAEWAHQHPGVHIVVTEFGVDDTAPQASRATWLGTARQQFEAAGFGWTVFHYEGSFGIKMDLEKGCDPVIRALGLCHQSAS